MIRLVLGAMTLVVGVGCGGSAQPSSEPTQGNVGANATLAKAKKPKETVPSKCMQRKGACMPPIKWAENLCKDVYPDLALYMFRSGTPWTRYYMRTGLNAVNGWGPTVQEELVTAEEVIVVNHRLKKFTMDVEGSAGTYDVLRWNGGCVTLDVNEVTKTSPPSVKHSKVNWRFLSDEVQKTLRRDTEVTETYRARRKECRGISLGSVSKQCELLDAKLGDVITDYVRRTTDIPVPEFHP